MPRSAVSLQDVLPRRAGAPRGAAHGMAKLTDADVRQMRGLFKAGGAINRIALAFGVSETTARNVVLRRTWTHVAD